MKVSSKQYLPLIALNSDNKIVKINNHILRKPMDILSQQSILNENSALITCNYIFNEKVFEWSSHIKAICHPYKKPSKFPDSIPKYLLSESDFCDEHTTPTNCGSAKKRWDFAYFTINSMQGINCKGLYMLPSIEKAATLAGLKGIVVNYGPEIRQGDIEEEYLRRTRKYMKSSKLHIKNKILGQKEICRLVSSVKFVIVPSTRDSSPRIIPEMLVRNVPVLLNKHIYGGWKYLNNDTGLFFSGMSLEDYYKNNNRDNIEIFEFDLSEKMKIMMDSEFKNVSTSYYTQFGFSKTAQRLADVFNKMQASDYKMVCYAEWKNILERFKNA